MAASHVTFTAAVESLRTISFLVQSPYDGRILVFSDSSVRSGTFLVET